jgi:hypothetical protein
MLDHFAWRRLMRRHHWNWTEVRRTLVTATGQWRQPSAGEIELRPIAAISSPRTWLRDEEAAG